MSAVLYFNELVQSPFRSGSLSITTSQGGTNPAGYPVSNLLDPDPSKTFRYQGAYAWINLQGINWTLRDYFQDKNGDKVRVAAIVLAGVRAWFTASGEKIQLINVALQFSPNANFSPVSIACERTVYLVDGMSETIVLPVYNNETDWNAGVSVEQTTPLWNDAYPYCRIVIAGFSSATVEVENIYAFEGRDVKVAETGLAISLVDASEVQRAYNRRAFVRERARSRVISCKLVGIDAEDVWGVPLDKDTLFTECQMDGASFNGTIEPPTAPSRGFQRVMSTTGKSRLVALMLKRYPARVPSHVRSGIKTYNPALITYQDQAYAAFGAQATTYVGFLTEPMRLTAVGMTDKDRPMFECDLQIEELDTTVTVASYL
jgi:hypothetical protein